MCRFKSDVFRVLVALCLAVSMICPVMANDQSTAASQPRNHVGEKLGQTATTVESTAAIMLGDWSRKSVFLDIPWASLLFAVALAINVSISVMLTP